MFLLCCQNDPWLDGGRSSRWEFCWKPPSEKRRRKKKYWLACKRKPHQQLIAATASEAAGKRRAFLTDGKNLFSHLNYPSLIFYSLKKVISFKSFIYWLCFLFAVFIIIVYISETINFITEMQNRNKSVIKFITFSKWSEEQHAWEWWHKAVKIRLHSQIKLDPRSAIEFS